MAEVGIPVLLANSANKLSFIGKKPLSKGSSLLW
jgi:hypothetical protein